MFLVFPYKKYFCVFLRTIRGIISPQNPTFLKYPSVSELCGIFAKIQTLANLPLGEYKLEHAFCVLAALCGLQDTSSRIRNGTRAPSSESTES